MTDVLQQQINYAVSGLNELAELNKKLGLTENKHAALKRALKAAGAEHTRFLSTTQKTTQNLLIQETAFKSITKSGVEFTAVLKEITDRVTGETEALVTNRTVLKQLSKEELARVNLKKKLRKEVISSALASEKETAAIKAGTATRQKSTQSVLAQVQAYQQLLRQQNLAEARGRIADRFVSGFNQDQIKPRTTADLSASQNLQILEQQNKVKEAFIQSGISVRQLDQTYGALTKGNLTDLSAAQLKVAKQIESLGHLYTKMGISGTKSFQRIQNEGQKSAHRVHLAWTNFASFFATHIVYTIAFRFVQAMKAGIDQSIELQKHISEIRTISQGQQIEFDRLTRKAAEVSNYVGLSVQDVAEGVYETVSNQLGQAEDSLIFVRRAGEFARATNSSVADSVNLLSSALNSFGYNVGVTEYVAQSLFRLIDLGRVRADELADTLGRVAVISAQTGVSIQEFNAALSELTIKGVPASEAQTQLYNVLQAVLKPSQALTKAFKDLGYESAEQALRLQGFAGFLATVKEEAGDSATELTKFFNRIRGLRGALGLVGDDSFERFNITLDKLTEETAKYYAEAKKIAFESEAVEFERNWTKIKNFFVVEVGPPLIRMANDIVESFKDFNQSVNESGIVLFRGKKAYHDYLIAQANAEQGQFLAERDVIQNNKKIRAVEEFTRNRVAELNTEQQKFGAQAVVTTAQVIDSVKDIVKSNRDQILSVILEAQSKLEGFQNLVETINAEVETIKSIKLERSLTTPTGRDTDQREDRSLVERVSILRNITDQAFRQAEKALAAQNFELASEKYQESITTLGRLQEEKQSVIERSAELQSRIGEIEAELAKELEGATTYDKNRLNREAEAEINRLQNQFNSNERLLARLRNLEEERIERLEKMRSLQNKLYADEGVKGQEEYIAKLEIQVESLQTLFDAIGNLKITDSKGQVLSPDKLEEVIQSLKDETLNFDSLLDSKTYELIASNLTTFEGSIRNAIEPATQFAEQIALINDKLAEVKQFEKDYTNLIGTINQTTSKIAVLKESVADFKGDPTGGLGISNNLTQKITASYDELINALDSATNQDEIVTLINDFNARLGEKSISFVGIPAPEIPKEQLNQYKLYLDEIGATYSELLKEQEALRLAREQEKTAQKEVGFNPDDLNEEYEARLQKEEELQAERKRLEEEIEDIRKKHDDQKIKDASALKEEIIAAYNAHAETVSQIFETTASKLDETDSQLESITGQLETQVEAISNGANGLTQFGQTMANEVLPSIFDQTKSYLYGVATDAAKGFISKIVSDIQNLVLPSPENSSPKVSSSGSNVVHRSFENPYGIATGGKIKYRASGGSIGTDTVPVMLSPGEFVMNRSATRRFYNQLVAMNAGGAVQSGGGNTQNFGDINVSVNAGSVNEQSARELARQIRQEIKRGSVRI